MCLPIFAPIGAAIGASAASAAAVGTVAAVATIGGAVALGGTLASQPKIDMGAANVPPPPSNVLTPPPPPSPTATTPNAGTQGRQKAASMLRYGALSTIAGGAAQGAGVAGTGPNLYPSMSTTGVKTTTGS